MWSVNKRVVTLIFEVHTLHEGQMVLQPSLFTRAVEKATRFVVLQERL